MKTTNCIEDGVDSWEEQYIEGSQIDRKLVNELINEDFDLTQADLDYWSAAIQYSISGIPKQYFATVMRKQKNDCNIPIYGKWLWLLPILDAILKASASNPCIQQRHHIWDY